jgi:phage tail tape-measure protein
MSRGIKIAFVLGALTFGWPTVARAAPSSVPSKVTKVAVGITFTTDVPARFGEKGGSHIGGACGAAIGAKIGMAFGPLGAIAGAFIGGLVGETIGSAVGEGLFGMNRGRPQLKPQ